MQKSNGLNSFRGIATLSAIGNIFDSFPLEDVNIQLGECFFIRNFLLIADNRLLRCFIGPKSHDLEQEFFLDLPFFEKLIRNFNFSKWHYNSKKMNLGGGLHPPPRPLSLIVRSSYASKIFEEYILHLICFESEINLPILFRTLSLLQGVLK